MADGRLRTWGEAVVGAAQVAGALALSPALRGWYGCWGAAKEEVSRALPGDELVPRPRMGYTRAVTIHARAAAAWPWLAQMGQGRGGLYSYEGLENLVGCRIRNVRRIVPELQAVKSGDLIRLGRKRYPCFRVWAAEPERALVLIAADVKTEEAVDLTPKAKGFSAATWQFFLEERSDGSTRLITRQRLD
jgi:hypothetical protein